MPAVDCIAMLCRMARVSRESVCAPTVNQVDYVEPPADPNEWSDDQWLEWLKATDVPTDELEEPLTNAVNRIIKSTPGQVLGQAMLGMAHAIYGRQEDGIVIVVKSTGETPDDEPYSIRLDPDHPGRASIVVRPNRNLPT